MTALKTWLPEAALAAGLAVLAALFFLPAPAARPVLTTQPAPADNEEYIERPAAGRPPDSVTPRQVAVLFGWKEKAPVPRVARPEPRTPRPPQEASWLRPMGFVIDDLGVRSYLFKDTRSGRVLSLIPGHESSGWRLKEISDGRFLLQSGGQDYTVRSK